MSPLLLICLLQPAIDPALEPALPAFLATDLPEVLAKPHPTAASNGTATDWQLSAELALSRQQRHWQSRLALDSRFSHNSDDQSAYVRWNSRLDGFGGTSDSDDNSAAVMSWKELYVGYRWNDSWLTELGRINQKNGVARGYNPTDFFAGNAVRAVISQQPAVLREQRLGSLMLRQQWLGDAQSVTLLWSPQLATQPDDATFSPDWARTNAVARWQISAEQQLYTGWTLGLLSYQSKNAEPQYGLNLSGALNERWLYHLEAATGSQPQFIVPPDSAWHASDIAANVNAGSTASRVATGVSYSLELPLTLTLEWQYDDAAAGRHDWQQLLELPALWQQYLQQRQGQQPTRQALLFQAQSQQWWPGFDWSCLWLHDLQDNSDMLLTELTWMKPEYDIVLQWQWAPGPTRSHFGAASSQLQLLLRYYF
ncbi:hypothetical protein EOE67_04255 [Rheinheimera riviphila]|uniref:Uncharacterized protein n=1 Tax=Rheinheimera riviphila TaxID=1834037 RepID=A0A437R218_9GAMM|nr:hypothetical protein [Rheinheimera riviphila]RVU40798.1 hypothetical protein EOE67_04255 [Rheinheimera riviphila]